LHIIQRFSYLLQKPVTWKEIAYYSKILVPSARPVTWTEIACYSKTVLPSAKPCTWTSSILFQDRLCDTLLRNHNLRCVTTSPAPHDCASAIFVVRRSKKSECRVLGYSPVFKFSHGPWVSWRSSMRFGPDNLTTYDSEILCRLCNNIKLSSR
jgi:hypothetical protein